jgi:hypothetical protein
MAVENPQRPQGLENSSPTFIQGEPGAGSGGGPVSTAASIDASVDPGFGSPLEDELDELELEDELEELDEEELPLEELLDDVSPLLLDDVSPLLLPGLFAVSASLHAMAKGTATANVTNKPNRRFRISSLILLNGTAQGFENELSRR